MNEVLRFLAQIYLSIKIIIFYRRNRCSIANECLNSRSSAIWHHHRLALYNFIYRLDLKDVKYFEQLSLNDIDTFWVPFKKIVSKQLFSINL